MSDHLTFTVDAAALKAALAVIGPAADPLVTAVSAETSTELVSEMQGRLGRQLGPNATGKTVASIVARPARDGHDFIVIAEREPFPILPYWLEKGTKKGKPGSHTEAAKPFFWVSVQIAQSSHIRRIAEALQQAIDAEGLGP